MRSFKNIMVTGGCGFIGTNFIRHLFEKTDFSGRVINVDKLTYAGNPESLADVEKNFPSRYRFEPVDICDAKEISRILKSCRIDAVCHFAAESHVDRSITGPGEFIQTNIVGTFTLLQCALEYWRTLRRTEDGERRTEDRAEAKRRQAGGHYSNEVATQMPEESELTSDLRSPTSEDHPPRAEDFRFHHVSTDEVFGSLGETGLFSETTAYQPNSPYSASKAGSDHLVRAYHETYGLNTTLSNCSNNYGPFQFPEKLIPLMILNALEGKPLPVYGDGKNVRDWLYVEDHAAAVWDIMTNGRSGETYNVGGRCELTNMEVVETICAILDEIAPLSQRTDVRGQMSDENSLTAEKQTSDLRTPISEQTLSSYRDLITFVPDRPGHDRRYAIDCSKIEAELGWEPQETFQSGLKKTIEWYLEHPDWIEHVRSGAYQDWIAKNYRDRQSTDCATRIC